MFTSIFKQYTQAFIKNYPLTNWETNVITQTRGKKNKFKVYAEIKQVNDLDSQGAIAAAELRVTEVTLITSIDRSKANRGNWTTKRLSYLNSKFKSDLIKYKNIMINLLLQQKKKGYWRARKIPLRATLPDDRRLEALAAAGGGLVGIQELAIRIKSYKVNMAKWYWQLIRRYIKTLYICLYFEQYCIQSLYAPGGKGRLADLEAYKIDCASIC